MTAPHATPVQSQPTARKVKGKGIAVTALVLGILALVFSWIPFVNIVGIIVGFIGIVFGLVGLFVSRRIMSAIGAVLALAGVVIGFSVTSSAVNSIDKSLNSTPTVKEVPAGGNAASGNGSGTTTFEYKATGSGSASITYGTFSGSGMSSSTSTSDLPWHKTFKVTGDGMFLPSVTVSGMSGNAVTCEIVKNGKVVAHQSATGSYATVDCSAS